MRILAPIDGSECSFRALRHATEMARALEADLHVVHVTDVEGEDTEALLERAREVLDEAGIEDDPEVATDLRLGQVGYADRVGEDVLGIADEGDYDHVVMGHHGSGIVKRAVLGSAAETVVRAGEVPVTVIC